MRPSTHKALLVIADISGFTRFMKSHENSADHAMQVVVELLKAVIAAAAPPLKLMEVEGDAAFFYAIRKDGGDDMADLAAIKKQVVNFFRTFYHTLRRLCALYPCARNAKDLRLKVVIHAGEAALEHIHGFDKLFGMDVILAHRLLKNSVPAQEYVLMTEAAYNWLGDFQQLEPMRQAEYCEGIGVVETAVFYLPAQLIRAGKRPDEQFHSNAAPFMPAVDLLNTACSRLGTALNECPLSEPLHPNARAQPMEVVRPAQFQNKIKWRPKHEIYVTDLL